MAANNANTGDAPSPPNAAQRMFGLFTQLADKVESVGLIGPEVHRAATSGNIRDLAPMNIVDAALADSRTRSQVRTAEDVAKQEGARREQFRMPTASRPLQTSSSARPDGSTPTPESSGSGQQDTDEQNGNSEDEQYWWERDGAFDEFRRRRRSTVGSVKISTLVGQDLCSAAKRSPYLHIAVEDTFKQTARLESATTRALPAANDGPSSGKDTAFWTWQLTDTQSDSEENALTFPITDVATDVSISLFAAKPIAPILGSRSDVCLGKVIIPLVHLLEEAGPFKTGTRTLDTWMTFYPLSVNELCFAPVVDGIPFSGMRRTASSIGRLHVRLELTLQVAPVVGYLRNPPFRPVAASMSNELSPVLLRQGTNRIANLTKNLGSMSFLVAFMELRDWDSPERSLAALLFVWVVCFLLPLWLMPAALSIAIVYLSWRTQQVTMPCRTFDCWNDQVALVLPDNVLQRLKLATSSVMRLQHMTNDAASAAERLCNCFNWTDPQVSILVSILTLCAGGLVSLAILTCTLISEYIVPFRHLAFYVIVASNLPPMLQDALLEEVRKVRKRLGIADEDVVEAVAAGDLSDDNEGEDEVGSVGVQTLLSKSLRRCWAAWMTAHAYARNLVDRVPDEMEVAHRSIARRQRLPVNPALVAHD